MQIAVLSGKGGTGKTFVSVNLAFAAQNTTYIDCDVEEPNGGLFLKPDITAEENIEVMIPKVNLEKCTACRKCVDFCKYNALALVNNRLLVFKELCHDCGGCILLCPEKALTEQGRTIGKVEYGISGEVKTRTGILNTGEAVGIPIIKRLIKDIEQENTYVIDSPPGSSCAVMESIKDCDYCILVTEPTLFGVHNLAMVYELVKLFAKPHGAIINKHIEGETVADDYCLQNNIPIIAKISYDDRIGSINSQGKIVAAEDGKYFAIFNEIFQKIQEEVQSEAVTNIKR